MAWELTGNPGIDPTTNFIGTTDNQPLVIKTKGTEALRIDPTGNVGIGTSSPQTKLEIKSGFDTEVLRFGYTAVHYHSISTTFHGDIPSVNYLGFNVEHSQSDIRRVLTLRGDGNVGIGTETPRATLDLPDGSVLSIGGIAAGGWIRFNNDANNQIGYEGNELGIYTNQANGIRFYTGGSNFRAIITSDGNMGIGTANPGAKLEVDGDVRVTGDVILPGADCAEEFDVAETVEIEPGTVMVLDQDGALSQSRHAYDKRVAGVISGAGEYKPGLILDRQQARDHRLPVALVGKVFCKVDAEYAPIAVGDLLTTSPTPGHAMKADDPLKAFGSVIGKALRSLETGRGLLPILIALQ